MEKTILAICYDFDKTLTINDMQTFSFIPSLGLSSNEFWAKCNELSNASKMDPVLSYLKLMVDESNARGIKLTRDYLNSQGKKIKFFDGVTTWFKRINRYADKHDIEVEHYIISSGNKEIIEGCSIFKEFKNVFGCEFFYNEEGVACWPKNIVNYTQKTQYLFRICKGAEDLSDEVLVNKRIDKKHVEFRNMIYIGDGLTDVPSMTLVKEKGGTSIAIYPSSKKEKSNELLRDSRVNYTCVGNFKENSPLEKLVKLIIDTTDLKEKLIQKENKQIARATSD